MKIKRLFEKLIQNPFRVFTPIWFYCAPIIKSDELFLKGLYLLRIGKPLDLANPTTFNEKLQWLKLYYRRPEYSRLVDKYLVKDIVASKLGSDKNIIPTLACFEKIEDIDITQLPDQFVLKCTHDSGGIAICKGKDKFNLQQAKSALAKGFEKNFYMYTREWPYKNVKPRIIAEPFMRDDKTGELRDYKFFCFDGEPKLMFIASDRYVSGEETKFDFFDMEFNKLPITHCHPHQENVITKPETWDEMISISKVLSAGIPHVRVDLYEVNGEVYFGELTFYHNCGTGIFEPREWDSIIGAYLHLPNKI